jgi:hypothetical protein
MCGFSRTVLCYIQLFTVRNLSYILEFVETGSKTKLKGFSGTIRLEGCRLASKIPVGASFVDISYSVNCRNTYSKRES